MPTISFSLTSPLFNKRPVVLPKSTANPASLLPDAKNRFVVLGTFSEIKTYVYSSPKDVILLVLKMPTERSRYDVETFIISGILR